MISIYYSSSSENLREFSLDNYCLAVSGIELRRNIISSITLPHPTIILDINILDSITFNLDEYINIEIDGVIRFRTYIFELHYNTDAKTVVIKCNDLLQKLSDKFISDMEITIFSSYNHNGIYEYKYIPGDHYANKRYVGIKFLIKVLIDQCGNVNYDNINVALTGNSIYYKSFPPYSGYQDYDRLGMQLETLQESGKTKHTSSGSTQLDLLLLILSSLNAIYEYNDNSIVISPQVDGLIGSDNDILTADYTDIKLESSVQITRSALSSYPIFAWTNDDLIKETQNYLAETTDPKKYKLPNIFEIGYLTRSFTYQPLETNSENCFTWQLARKYYNDINDYDKVHYKSKNGLLNESSFWFQSCLYNIESNWKKIEYLSIRLSAGGGI